MATKNNRFLVRGWNLFVYQLPLHDIVYDTFSETNGDGSCTYWLNTKIDGSLYHEYFRETQYLTYIPIDQHEDFQKFKTKLWTFKQMSFVKYNLCKFIYLLLNWILETLVTVLKP